MPDLSQKSIKNDFYNEIFFFETIQNIFFTPVIESEELDMNILENIEDYKK
ncbi:MAG: hypothetical protein LBS95_00860 [Mycoplasmataceae bacterium]|jgi:hypothetical protein|nr:hypothetical protein [Mycoplasmataceae bacterium]